VQIRCKAAAVIGEASELMYAIADDSFKNGCGKVIRGRKEP